MISKRQYPVSFAVIMLVAASVLSVSVAAQTPSTAVPSPAWKLVWSDEFNGPNGSAVDASKWVSETGGGGWGNNELEYYQAGSANANQANGALTIQARQQSVGGMPYTSARIKTQDWCSGMIIRSVLGS